MLKLTILTVTHLSDMLKLMIGATARTRNVETPSSSRKSKSSFFWLKQPLLLWCFYVKPLFVLSKHLSIP
jgi:hypothetical protein